MVNKHIINWRSESDDADTIDSSGSDSSGSVAGAHPRIQSHDERVSSTQNGGRRRLRKSNEKTGESSTFSTGLSKVRFPSPKNSGNATAGAHAEGIGSFWELWTFTSNIRIVEEKLRTQARSNVQNEDKVKQRLEQREKEKAEQKAKEKAKK